MSFLIPGEEIVELYHSPKRISLTEKVSLKSEKGHSIFLRPCNSATKKKYNASHVLKLGNRRRVQIYLPKSYHKEYGYGKIQGENSLVLIHFIGVKMVEVSIVKDGWPYSNLIFFHYINNKLK